MNLTNLFIASLLSTSYLTHLLHRVITDGEYNSVLLINADPYIGHTDFFPQMADLSNGKYAWFTTDSEYHNTVSWFDNKWMPNRNLFGILQVLLLNYHNDEMGQAPLKYVNRKRCLQIKSVMLNSNNYYKAQNVVVLYPMQSYDQHKDFWRCSRQFQEYFIVENCSVILYRTQAAMTAKTLRKPLEIFFVKSGKYAEINVKTASVMGAMCTIKYSDRFRRQPI